MEKSSNNTNSNKLDSNKDLSLPRNSTKSLNYINYQINTESNDEFVEISDLPNINIKTNNYQISKPNAYFSSNIQSYRQSVIVNNQKDSDDLFNKEVKFNKEIFKIEENTSKVSCKRCGISLFIYKE